MNTEPINGHDTEHPAATAIPLHRLHNLDIPFPATPVAEAFGGDMPEGAVFVRAYCYNKPGSAFAATPVPPMKMLRLVFRAIEGAASAPLAFLIVPGPTGVYQRDGVEFLDAVVDSANGAPWSLWSTPAPERAGGS